MKAFVSIVLTIVVVLACVLAFPFLLVLSVAEDVYLLCWIGGDCIKTAWGRQA